MLHITSYCIHKILTYDYMYGILNRICDEEVDLRARKRVLLWNGNEGGTAGLKRLVPVDYLLIDRDEFFC